MPRPAHGAQSWVGEEGATGVAQLATLGSRGTDSSPAGGRSRIRTACRLTSSPSVGHAMPDQPATSRQLRRSAGAAPASAGDHAVGIRSSRPSASAMVSHSSVISTPCARSDLRPPGVRVVATLRNSMLQDSPRASTRDQRCDGVPRADRAFRALHPIWRSVAGPCVASSMRQLGHGRQRRPRLRVVCLDHEIMATAIARYGTRRAVPSDDWARTARR